MESGIAITGMSGKLPQSANLAEFRDNLFKKIDLITESTKRWEPGLYGLPKLLGLIKDLSKFDAEYFGLHPRQANQMDPQVRMLLECSYEAIVDAGYDPADLRGKNIGVYIGNCISETEEFNTMDPKKIDGYGMTGTARAMFSNRISYSFNFKGPSVLMDTACSSGAYALCDAVKAIKNGDCEAALVGAANLCLRPGTSLQFCRLNVLSDDGLSKSFDASADGYARSEGVVCFFLQKVDVARRIYANIVHIKTNTDGYKEEGITFPSAEMQKRLLAEVYEESGFDPLKISYLEAHATGTAVGDPEEMLAVADIFCEGREEPLLIGSVKSNMGHSEPVSGLCSIVKVIIGMETGLLPPNLHYETPNPRIPCLLNGDVKIVTDAMPWKCDYASVSCFGFGGVNVHTILKSNPKIHGDENKTNEFPQLLIYSGRTEESVQIMFDYVENNSVPREFFALLHKSVYSPVQIRPFRGYKVVNSDSSYSAIKKLNTETRPVWFVFSGMGTQWPAMGRDLMNLEVFSKSVHKSAEILKPFGIDLIELLVNDMSKGNNEQNSTVPAFVTIAAVQIALVDILKELGIQPDGIVGHSVGELGCAYADGCFTAEQMILSAYWRGKVVDDTNLMPGSMAAVGMTWEEAKKQCPEGIYPSCYNAEDSITISGPKESMKNFISSLKAQNTFAREVDSSGYAFHSKYIFPAAEKLKTMLESVIPNPKPRSATWISSSYPQEQWDVPESKFASSSYFVHNLISPVLFHSALSHVPKDAIVIEIAPHHLLQAILKRTLGFHAEFIGLMKRNTDNSLFLLSSIGKMYASGLNPNIEKLYPEISFPVPRGTPAIAHLIGWDHSVTWDVAVWKSIGAQSQRIVEVQIDVPDSPDAYIIGHCIDGRILYPATGYLMLAWRLFAELKHKNISELPVIIEDFKIHRATILTKSTKTKLFVDIATAGGQFEISESGMVVVSGRICSFTANLNEEPIKYWNDNPSAVKLTSQDVYKEFRLRGYDYGPTFQGIQEFNLDGNQGLLKWNGNWVTFMDAMLQSNLLSTFRALHLPTAIEKITINPYQQKKLEALAQEMGGMPIAGDKVTRKMRCGGVEMETLKPNIAPRQPINQTPFLEEYIYIPYNEVNVLPKSQKDFAEKYINECLVTAKDILKYIENNKKDGSIKISDTINAHFESKGNNIEICQDSTSEESVLLKYLKEMRKLIETEDIKEVATSTLKNYLNERQNDILEKLSEEEIVLRPLLDIAMENIKVTLNIMELHDKNFPFSIRIRKLSQVIYPMFLNYYTVAHLDPAVLSPEMLAVHHISVAKWSLDENTLNLGNVDLLIMKNLNLNQTEIKESIKNLIKTLRIGGFVLISQRTKLLLAESFLSAISETSLNVISENSLEKIFEEFGLEVIAKRTDGIASVYHLLRKITDSNSEVTNAVVNVESGNYDKWVEEVKTELNKAKTAKNTHQIWMVSDNEDNTCGIVGFINCLKEEFGSACIKSVFIHSNSNLPKFTLDNPIYQEIIKKGLVMNVYKNKTWGSFRYITIKTENQANYSKYAYLNALTRGDLSSLKWIESPLKYYSLSPIPNTILCQVYYAPLNFRDVMLATGRLPANAIPGNLAKQDCILGLEFSGRTMNGERIMGLVSNKGLATTVAADPEFLWKVPNNWTLGEASTVPVAYCTAYYALIIRGNLQKGESVLIHSGSGAVGQAAISITLSLNCQIFTTVGTKEKREFLKQRFPQLSDENICNSRDISFKEHILKATKGKGVNVILNSLADDKLKASVQCLSQHGRFLEIGKYDLSNNTPLGMAVFLKNITFHGILLDAIFENDNHSLANKKQVFKLITDGIKQGVVKPLNLVLFNNNEVEQAFRFMASGRHIGKVVIKIREEEPKKVVTPTFMELSVIRRVYFDPRKTYILVGGLGGFGIEMCFWLIERGASNIILTSRYGIKTGYQRFCLELWKKESANVMISTLDATDKKQAKELLQLGAKYGPIGGIFNLVVVTRDAFMDKQTGENFKIVCKSKMDSTVNLDELSRKLCPELEWFVCFSSQSCGRGTPGQSNYGYANSVMERICEIRFMEGLPGLAIQWGPIADVGILYEAIGNDYILGGSLQQKIRSCIKVLDTLLQRERPVVSSIIPRQIEKSSSKTKKVDVLETIANVFGLNDISSLNLEAKLGDLGMDSLMAVELQQFLERDLSIVVNLQELREMQIKDLCKFSGDFNLAKKGKDDEIQHNSSKRGGTDVHLTIQVPSDKQIIAINTIVTLNDVKNGIPLFMVHPIEGFVSMLRSVAKLIRCPVYGIQYTTDSPVSSLEDLAAWYFEKIKALNIQGPINIAGYSMGATISYEMALQIERNPQAHPTVNSFILMEGAPSFPITYFSQNNNQYFSYSPIEKEAHILCAFFIMVTQTNKPELKTYLIQLSNFDERVHHIAKEVMLSRDGLLLDELVTAIKLFYNQMIMGSIYSPKVKLQRDIVLLKSKESIKLTRNFSEKYDLEKFCSGKITVHTMQGNHTTFIESDNAKEVSETINSILQC